MLPERLRLAAKLGSVIPFIGSGVSQLGGCPGWEEFANAALRFFLRPDQLNHAQFDQLARLSPRMKLSVAVGLEQQYETKINFKSILESRDANMKATGEKVYGPRACWSSKRVASARLARSLTFWRIPQPPSSKRSLDGTNRRPTF